MYYHFSLIMNNTVSTSYLVMDNEGDNNLEGLDATNICYYQQLITVLCYLLMVTDYDKNTNKLIYNNYLSVINNDNDGYLKKCDCNYMQNYIYILKNMLYNNIKDIKINENNLDSIVIIPNLNNLSGLIYQLNIIGIAKVLSTSRDIYKKSPLQFPPPQNRNFPHKGKLLIAYNTVSGSPLAKYITTFFAQNTNDFTNTNLDFILQQYGNLYNNLSYKKSYESTNQPYDPFA